MKPAILLTFRWVVVGIFALLGGARFTAAQSSACSASPAYSPDFSQNQSCLTLNGLNGGYSGSPSFQAPLAAVPSVSTALQLTANQGGWATSAWYSVPQNVANGFSTTFSFQIGNPSTYDADGIAFVIQNSSLAALGPGGCGIGFGASSSGCGSGSGIPNSVAIEFNTYLNGGIDPSGDDVAIQSCGGVSANSVDPACRLNFNDLSGKINLTDGQTHVATVTYSPSSQSNCGTSGTQGCSALDVVVDGIDLFPGGVLFDMNSIGLSTSTAYVGFTAGTGGGNDAQDIVNWTFTPQGASSTQTISPGQNSPTTYKINGGFVEGSPTSGYDFTALETDTNLQLKMVVTAIPISQQACNALVQANPKYKSAECFVYQNGGGQGNDTAVLFEVTCPPNGSCGSSANPFDADLGTNFNFDCSENVPLLCGLPPAPFTFGFPNLTSVDGLPEIGFLKGEGPDAIHPCTPDPSGTTSLFQSNQIKSFALGDTSGGTKAGSGGTTSCWTLTYATQNETPTVSMSQPVNGGTYTQGESDATTLANYSCSAVNAGSGSPVGPYLTVASCSAVDSTGVTVATGTPFDTSKVGPHTITVQVQDSATNTNQQTVTYTVVAPAAITSTTSAATFTVGTAGSVVISATGYPQPALTESGVLPAGVTFVDHHNGMATLGGVPTVSGIFPITFTAQNGVGTPATLGFTLTVVATIPSSGKACNGVYNGTFKGNLTVTAGQSCIFIGGGVTGNITQTGGSLGLNHAGIGGNIQVSGPSAFSIGPSVNVSGNVVAQTVNGGTANQVCGATIAGNLTDQSNLASVSIGSLAAACPGNVIAGNLVVQANSGAEVVDSNTVSGNILVQSNTGSTQVFANHTHASLQCDANTTITGGNNVAGKKLDQCAAF